MSDTCVFCAKILDGSAEYDARVGIWTFEPLNPVTPGHLLFIDESHFPRPHHNPAITGLLFGAAATHGGRMGEDYNLIVNGGPDAGQTVFHVHIHYVPRRPGDGLLLPWGGVHV
jgi:histidine triad (HIT) family protein